MMIALRRCFALGLSAIVSLSVLELPTHHNGVAVAQPPGRGKTKKAAKKAPAGKAAAAKTVAVDLGEASWPQFLGPDRNNISREKGLLKKWPANGPKLLTTFSGLGVGFSNLAIADNVVYSMGNRGEREYVFALSLETGEMLWDHDNAGAYHNGFGDGPRGTPTLDGERLYALGATGQLVCLDTESGKPIWKKSLTGEFGTSIPSWGLCESVLIDGDKAIVTPGGSRGLMAAYDKKTGESVWVSPAKQSDHAAYASAIAVDVDGVRQYVNYTSAGTVGIRASDGKFMWRDDSSANTTANCCAPVFADGMAFTASGYGKGASMELLTSSGDMTSAEFKYHTNDLKVHHGGLVLFGGHVYGSNDPGILVCVELKTGKTKWQSRSVGKGSLTCADGHLIVRSEQGPVALVQATSAGYKELARFSPGDRSNSQAWTYPVVCGGKLFLRDQDILQVYDVEDR